MGFHCYCCEVSCQFCCYSFGSNPSLLSAFTIFPSSLLFFSLLLYVKVWISFYFSFLWFIVLPASKNSYLLSILENSPTLSSNTDFPHSILQNSNHIHIIFSYAILCVWVCFSYLRLLTLFGPVSLSLFRYVSLFPPASSLSPFGKGPLTECISEISFWETLISLFTYFHFQMIKGSPVSCNSTVLPECTGMSDEKFPQVAHTMKSDVSPGNPRAESGSTEVKLV